MKQVQSGAFAGIGNVINQDNINGKIEDIENGSFVLGAPTEFTTIKKKLMKAEKSGSDLSDISTMSGSDNSIFSDNKNKLFGKKKISIKDLSEEEDEEEEEDSYESEEEESGDYSDTDMEEEFYDPIDIKGGKSSKPNQNKNTKEHLELIDVIEQKRKNLLDKGIVLPRIDTKKVEKNPVYANEICEVLSNLDEDHKNTDTIITCIKAVLKFMCDLFKKSKLTFLGYKIDITGYDRLVIADLMDNKGDIIDFTGYTRRKLGKLFFRLLRYFKMIFINAAVCIHNNNKNTNSNILTYDSDEEESSDSDDLDNSESDEETESETDTGSSSD